MAWPIYIFTGWSTGLFWALLGPFGLFWALLGSFGPFWALYSANEQVRAGPDFPIVAPSLSWSLYTKLHTTSTTTTVLEKSQLLKGFQVEQKKNTRVARPKSHVTPTDAPDTPRTPITTPQKVILYTFSFLHLWSLLRSIDMHWLSLHFKKIF